MFPFKKSNITYQYNNDERHFYREYTVNEPIARGYNDPPEMVGLGDGSGPHFLIPPEAFEYLAVTYLRIHGYYVASPSDIKFTAVISPEGRE